MAPYNMDIKREFEIWYCFSTINQFQSKRQFIQIYRRKNWNAISEQKLNDEKLNKQNRVWDYGLANEFYMSKTSKQINNFPIKHFPNEFFFLLALQIDLLIPSLLLIHLLTRLLQTSFCHLRELHDHPLLLPIHQKYEIIGLF